ncbi:LOW QUALITY PROTEIN: hypothetical protein LZ30DRAFT_756018 [Colletotrichum cereale]|nr:LOW QUALITY PROTEIN: hypothetical protein LZ30DRAFT_756018 [Colletotrichum cereale]
MAEALLGLAPSYGDAHSDKPPIAHPDDLPSLLRRDLETKKTPTRCEHVSVTLEVPSTVEFAIHISDGDAQENVDPTLDGVRPQAVGGQPVKIVRAYDTIISQPHDNPSMQRAVAKHIVGLLSTADESMWVVREVSRGQYGWAFTYMCKDSVAMWSRQNGKTVAKPLIGDYSQKELEPAISGRPAFDCRGVLTIAFSKNSRTINVKYEHTPFHKTVGEMIEHFRPLPPAAPPAPLIPAGDRPKKAKTLRKRKSEANADGTPSRPKKKRKSEANGDGTPSQPKKKRKENSEATAGAGGAQEEAAGDSQTTATVPTKADAAVQSGVHEHAVLDVPPAEAARRREVAIRLLSGSGVDPESLSTEQFSIFANQSPDLQKESLAMLVKYGAERLRIVHPSDAAASSPTTASPTPQQATAEPEADSLEATLENSAPAKKKRSRKSNAAAGDAEEADLIPAPAGTPLKQVSRGSCIACRRAKTKCDRAKPTCSSCENQNAECHYPLVRKQAARKKEESPTTSLGNGDDDDAEAEPEPEHEPTPEPATETEEQEPDDIETIDYTSNMPVANMLTPAVEPPNQDYFNSGHNELAFTQDASNAMSMSHGVSSYPEPSATVTCTEQQTATTTYGQTSPLTETATYTQPSADATGYVQPTSNENVGYLQTADASNLNYAQPAVKSPRSTRAPKTRRSLPSEQPQQSAAETPVPPSEYTQDWHSLSPPKATITPSPITTARQRRQQKSAQAPTPTAVTQQSASHDNHDKTQQAAVHAAMDQHQHQKQQHRPSPMQQVAQVGQMPEAVTPAQASPFQAPEQAARTKSRAGHRASTRTPVNEQRAPPSQKIAPPSTQGTMDYNTYNANASDTTGVDTRLASANTTTYPSYDYDRSNTITGLAYTPSNNPRSGQLYNTQPQNRNTQPYGSNDANSSAANSYTQPSSTEPQRSSTPQSFASQARSSTRPNSQQKQQQQQQQRHHQQHQQQPQQPQSYGSYSSQTHQQTHQPDQHNCGSFPPANVSGGGSAPTNYGAGSSTSNANQAYQQQQHHSSGDSDMYELLKNSLHGPGR